MFKNKFRFSIFCCFVAFATLFQTGCGSSDTSSSAKSETIVFWNTMAKAELELMPEVISEFEKKYPNIKVKQKVIDFYKAKEKFIESADNPPDVMRTDRFWLPNLFKKNLLMVFSQKEFKTEISDMIPIAKSIVTVDKKICALPISVDCLALFYNKKLFKKHNIMPPNNFDEFSAAAVKLTDPNEGVYGFFVYPNPWYFEPFLFGFGGRYFSNSGKLAINSDQTKKAMDFIVRLKDSLRVVPPVNLRQDAYKTMIAGFKGGQISMIFCGPWAIRGLIQGQEFKDNQSNLGVYPLPSGPSGVFPPVGCQSLVISSNSKHKSSAIKFVKFMYSPEIQAKLAKVNYGLPVRKSVFYDKELSRDPFLKNFIVELKAIKNYKVNSLRGNIYQPLSKILRKVFNGDITPTNALQDFEKEWHDKYK